MQSQPEIKQPSTVKGNLKPEKQNIPEFLARFVDGHYVWYIISLAACLAIFSFAPYFYSLLNLTAARGWEGPYYIALYRVIFLLFVAVLSWRFGILRGLFASVFLTVVVLLPYSLGLRKDSFFLDVGTILIGYVVSGVIGRQGALQSQLFNSASEIREQAEQLTLEIAEREKAEKEIRKLSVGSIESLVFALEAKDKYSAGHSRRVTAMAVCIGNKMNLSKKDLEDLCYGSLLHDVGKIAVDQLIQNKTGSLTPPEYAHIMIHVHTGVDIVKSIVNSSVVALVEHHHDRYNGSAEQELAGEQIPLGAG